MPINYYINSSCNSIPDNLTSKILINSNALKFHKSLPEYSATPLISLPNLSSKYGVGSIYTKDESKRFGLNAFKGLGASFAVHQSLLKNPDIETFCAATDGNHGRAVAWSAKRNGKKSIIFVPETTTIKRIESIEKEGAKVIRINGNYDEALKKAEKETESNHSTLIQDTAWKGYLEIPALIVSGYLTLFRELEDSLHTPEVPGIDIIFIQAGVGSLAAAGIFYYLNKYQENKPKVIIVEPEETDGILRSFQNNKISTSKGNSKTIMAGLNCETPSLGAWGLLQNGVDYSIRIKDKYAKKAMQRWYYPTGSDSKIISGESGAAGFAGFLSIMNEKHFKSLRSKLKLNKETNILFINTEGDTDKKYLKNNE